MEKEFMDVPITNPGIDAPSKKKRLALPISALACEVGGPIVFFLLTLLSVSVGFLNFLAWPCLLMIILSPVAGIIIGIISLCFGKKEIGKSGVIMSIISLVLPVVLIVPIFWLSMLALAAGM